VVRGGKASLWARARAGDRQALARVVQRYQQPLAGYLWALGITRERLEPLLVETFVAAARAPADPASARRALYLAATHRARQHGVGLNRCLLVLCCLEGFSYPQAARLLGLPPATVRARVRRARVALG
jgi:DNA-directed RNA polymerase specialized sigma24 family protein